MKKMLLLCLISLNIISCSSCVKQNPTPVPIAPPVVDPVVPPPQPNAINPLLVQGEGFEFLLPGEGWESLDQVIDGVAFGNRSIENLIALELKPFNSSLDNLALLTLREIREFGATIVSSKQITLNNNKFVLIEAFKGDNKIWTWVTVTGTLGIAFACGGRYDITDQQKLCFGVVNTLKVK